MNKREIDGLLSLISQGDNRAFEKLYLETKRGVYAFLSTYLTNYADCEDAMQDVYMKIKTCISQYRVGSNGLAWILQIAKNTALNELRKRTYRTQNYTQTEEESVIDVVVLRDSITDAMNRVLSDEEKRLIVLHVIWSYKHKEIAKMLNCPLGTVTSKYKRAVEKLKKYLKEEERK